MSAHYERSGWCATIALHTDYSVPKDVTGAIYIHVIALAEVLYDVYPSSFVGGRPIIYIYSTLHHIATDHQRQTFLVLTGTMSDPCM